MVQWHGLYSVPVCENVQSVIQITHTRLIFWLKGTEYITADKVCKHCREHFTESYNPRSTVMIYVIERYVFNPPSYSLHPHYSSSLSIKKKKGLRDLHYFICTVVLCESFIFCINIYHKIISELSMSSTISRTLNNYVVHGNAHLQFGHVDQKSKCIKIKLLL